MLSYCVYILPAPFPTIFTNISKVDSKELEKDGIDIMHNKITLWSITGTVWSDKEQDDDDV